MVAVDIDQDGDTDLAGANWHGETPFELWRNDLDPTVSLDHWERHLIDGALPHKAIFVAAGDIDGDQLADLVTGGWWYRNPGAIDAAWTRTAFGGSLANMALLEDFDGDQDLDVLGTNGTFTGSQFHWAENDGGGGFTVHSRGWPQPTLPPASRAAWRSRGTRPAAESRC
jgi:hypothetical protein